MKLFKAYLAFTGLESISFVSSSNKHGRHNIKAVSNRGQKNSILFVVDSKELNANEIITALQGGGFVAIYPRIGKSSRGDIVIAVRKFFIGVLDTPCRWTMKIIKTEEKRTAMTSRSCDFDTEPYISTISSSRTGSHWERWNLFLIDKEEQKSIKATCRRSTCRGNHYLEEYEL